MFRVTASRFSGSPLTRRSFVEAGVLGIGGLSLAQYLQCREAAAARFHGHSSAVNPATETAVILVWMSGGPGHHETWDPKPDAVSQYRGPFGAISTSLPGTRFSEMIPEQAQLADQMAILRTVNHGSGDHTKGNHWMLTGFEGPDFNKPDNRIQRHPAMGSVASALCGPRRPGLPAKAHALGLRLKVYTVDDLRAMEEVRDLGVDGVFTNFPDRLIALLAGQGRASPRGRSSP